MGRLEIYQMRKVAGSIFIFALAGLLVSSSLADTSARSKDGKVEVSLPEGWTQTSLPDSHANIDLHHPDSRGVATVRTELKSDLPDQDLKHYAAGKIKHLTLTNRKMGAPQEVTINRMPAVRYEATGEVKDYKGKYWFTFFETDTQFIEVTTWSVPSKFDDNKKDFDYLCGHVTVH